MFHKHIQFKDFFLSSSFSVLNVYLPLCIAMDCSVTTVSVFKFCPTTFFFHLGNNGGNGQIFCSQDISVCLYAEIYL